MRLVLALGWISWLAPAHFSLVSRPLSVLLTFVPDDTFYYLGLARHIVAGHGPTFDGIHPTSGYHPAWLACLLPLAALFPASESLLRSALMLEFAVHIATAVLVAVWLEPRTTPTFATLVGLCWLTNPLANLLVAQGLESALYQFALVLTLLGMDRFVEDPSPGAYRHLALASALGLTFLARTEGAIFVGLGLAAIPLLATHLELRQRFRSVLVVGAIVGILVAPWFLYCWTTTGSVWQSSGAMKALWAGEYLRPLPISEQIRRAASVLYVKWLGVPLAPLGAASVPWSGLALLGVLPAGVAAVLGVARRATPRGMAVWSLWLLGALVLTGAVIGFFLYDVQLWWAAQPAILIFALCFAWIGAASRAWSQPLPRLLCGLSPLLLLLLSTLETNWLERNPPASFPWQADMYSSQPAFEKRVPAGARIGCFNAGIPGFFGSRTIVNLDGLVNASIVAYYREHRVESYLAEHSIEYVADEMNSIERAGRFMAHAPELEVLASAPLSGWPWGRRYLFHVLPAGSAPAASGALDTE